MKLIGFTGAMGVGKSTAIEFLREYFNEQQITNVKFAQPLYDMQEFIYRRIADVHPRPKDFVKDRKLLQWLGTEWGRDSIKETLWGDLWEKEVRTIDSGWYNMLITCDDIRFDNEAERVDDLGGFIIKLTSNMTEERINTKAGLAQHKSEAGVNPKFISYEIANDTTIAEFRTKLFKVYDDIALKFQEAKNAVNSA